MDKQIANGLATISDAQSKVAVETELPSVLDRAAKGASAVVVPGALASFRKRADRHLRKHLEEDLAIWRRVRGDAQTARGWTFLYAREMDRISAALAKIIGSNEQLIVRNDALQPLVTPSASHTEVPSHP
jgi:hypothetical protein